MLGERDKGGTTRASKSAMWVSFLERVDVDLFPKNQAERLFLLGSEAEDVEGEDFRVAEEDEDEVDVDELD